MLEKKKIYGINIFPKNRFNTISNAACIFEGCPEKRLSIMVVKNGFAQELAERGNIYNNYRLGIQKLYFGRNYGL